MDKKLFTALSASVEQFRSEYATLILKFDYKKKQATEEINKSIFNIIRNLIRKKSNAEYFNTLTVRAEDNEKNNLLENFDLLVDLVKSEVWVEKKERYRTVVSANIFEQMTSELIKKKI
jgi:hypothetical protein